MDDEKDAIFFVALCLCYFHPQIGIPDAKVTIITHLSFSQQLWRMQQIPKPEIRYTECFIWFYKHIHSLVFSIWIRDLNHSQKQKNWSSADMGLDSQILGSCFSWSIESALHCQQSGLHAYLTLDQAAIHAVIHDGHSRWKVGWHTTPH